MRHSCPMTAREDFLASEATWDEAVAQIPALTLDRGRLLTCLYNFLWQMESGGLVGDGPTMGRGALVAHRLSLVTRLILGTAIEAPLRLQAPTREQMRSVISLVSYARLSEVTPDVRRNNYVVEGSRTERIRHAITGETRALKIFNLNYPDSEWANLESLDLALGTVGRPLAVRPPSASPHRIRIAMEALLSGDMLPAAKLIVRFSQHYIQGVHEIGALGDAGLPSAVGMDSASFGRLRAVLMGIGQLGIQAAGLLQRDMRLMGRTEERARDLLDWTAMQVDTSWLETTLADVAGVDVPKVRNVLELMSLGGYEQPNEWGLNAGDGFYPPLARFGNYVLFSPLVLLTMLNERNIVFALNRTDRERFDVDISPRLEPKLLADMTRILALDPGLEVRQCISWAAGSERGEIDAIIARRGSPGILQVQAKGAIPPGGSRSTAHVEHRVNEGLLQVRRFASLPSHERDRILGQALGWPVDGEPLLGAVIVRASIGTPRVWRQAGDTLLLSLPLLRAVVRTEVERSGLVSPSALPQATRGQLDALRLAAAPTIGRAVEDLDWIGLDAPKVAFNDEALARLAARWAK